MVRYDTTPKSLLLIDPYQRLRSISAHFFSPWGMLLTTVALEPWRGVRRVHGLGWSRQ